MAEVVGEFFQVRGMGRVPEADEFLARQFPQADGGPGGEGMLRMADEGQRLPARDLQDQSGPALRMNGQAQVRLQVLHGVMHAGGRGVTDRHPRRRVRGLKPAEAGGQLWWKPMLRQTARWNSLAASSCARSSSASSRRMIPAIRAQ